MAYYKMNDLQLHLSITISSLQHLAEHQKNNSSMFLNMPRLVSVETDIVGKNGQKLKYQMHYTKEEMQNQIKLAKALHINLVPEIGHTRSALSFVKVRPRPHVSR